MTANVIFTLILFVSALINLYCGYKKIVSKLHDFPNWASAFNFCLAVVVGIPAIGVLNENFKLIDNSGVGFLTGILICGVTMFLSYRYGKRYHRFVGPIFICFSNCTKNAVAWTAAKFRRRQSQPQSEK
jgi:uncharacterized membrane protein